jgi:hypothetical protein
MINIVNYRFNRDGKLLSKTPEQPIPDDGSLERGARLLFELSLAKDD